MAEREYHQAIRDIDRLSIRPGKLRALRTRLRPLLDHPDQRVRACAEELLRPPQHEAVAEWEWGGAPDDGGSGSPCSDRGRHEDEENPF